MNKYKLLHFFYKHQRIMNILVILNVLVQVGLLFTGILKGDPHLFQLMLATLSILFFIMFQEIKRILWEFEENV